MIYFDKNSYNYLKKLFFKERNLILNKLTELNTWSEDTLRKSLQYFGNNLFAYKSGNRFIIIFQIIDKDLIVRQIYWGSDVQKKYEKQDYLDLKSKNWLRKHPLQEKANTIPLENSDIQEVNKERLPLPNEFIEWKEDLFFDIKHDIYEFEDWLNYIQNDSQTEGMRERDVLRFGEYLKDIINKKTNIKNPILINKKSGINKLQKNGIILYLSFHKNEEKNIIILYGGCNNDVQKEYCKKLEKKLTELELDFNSDPELIKRYAHRAYPSWTLKTSENIEKFWYPIIKNSEYDNLALLNEQKQLLNKLKEKLPIYIRGQAGSGKSTILYYIFSHLYYLIKLNNDKDYILKNKIIFLTENAYLLKKTKQIVKGLLLNNPQWNLSIEHLQDLDSYFSTFKNFLQSFLNEEEKEKFPSEKYLNFAEFKRLFNNQYQFKRISITPEEAWYTITSFIFGYDLEEPYFIDRYEEITRHFKETIPRDKYKKIQEEIVPFYRKLLEENDYWDRLRLIKYLNDNNKIKPKYLVIICDESQDFTRAEIQFIIKTSIFYNYNLSKAEIVPLIFAGDQNQTVNPTGYRDDEIRGLITQELKNLDFTKNINDFISNYNYRSIKPVVNLANYIQYYRKKKLGLSIDLPQRPKRPGSELSFNNFYTTKFLNETNLKEEIRKRIKYKMFIIPADTYEKEEFQKEKLLTQLVDSNDLIRTAIETKGVEYHQVVLYKFGDYFIKNIFTDLRKFNDGLDENKIFEFKYFFNKLYVSITRAQNELIIIDSEEAYEKFWDVIQNFEIKDANWAEELNEYKGRLINKTNSIEDILISSQETAINTAYKEKEAGLLENSPERLRLAAKIFEKYGEKKEAFISIALAYEMEGSYLKAAQKYEQIGDYDAVSSLFFKKREIQLFKEIPFNNLRDRSLHELRHIFIKILIDDNILPTEISKIFKFINLSKQVLEDINWEDEIFERLLKLEKRFSYSIKREIFSLIYKLKKNNKINKKLAELGFNLQLYDKVIELLESINDEEHYTPFYYKSKIELAIKQEDYNELLENLYKLIEIELKPSNLDLVLILFDKYKENFEKSNEIYLFIKLISDLKHYRYEELENDFKKFEKSDIVNMWYETLLNTLQFIVIDSNIYSFIIERWAFHKYKEGGNLKQINEKYKYLSQKFNIKFVPFDQPELQNIRLEENLNRLRSFPNQFKNIIIKNFRQFNKLEIEDLGLINLIVGDNNAGKTSILEALLIEEDKERTINNLYYTYSKRFGETLFSNGFLKDYKNITNEEANKTILTAYEKRYFWNKKINLDENLPENKMSSIVPFIPFGRETVKYFVSFFKDEIFLYRKKRLDFIEKMKVFIPDISGVLIDENKILIETSSNEKPEPIGHFGEGAFKMFQILVYIYYFSGKRFMIDEIDAGIHFSNLKQFWTVILELAKQVNTQIFATTHNKECLEVFNLTLKEEKFIEIKEFSRIITLYKLSNTNFKAYTYRFEDFDYLLTEGYEIRGEKL